MTDEQARTRELSRKLREAVMRAPVDIDAAEAMEPILAQALAARERAIWLEAAERLEDDCYWGPTVDHDFLGHDDLGNERFKHNTNQVRIAKEFRQQAEAEDRVIREQSNTNAALKTRDEYQEQVASLRQQLVTAPDLLAQLRLAHRMLLQTDWRHEDEAMNEIVAAIAKAEEGMDGLHR